MKPAAKGSFSRIAVLMTVLLSMLALGACSADCHCPECGKTTVVTPPGSTVVRPD